MSKSGINLQPLRDAIPKYKAHVEQQRAQRAVDKLAASLRANNARHAFDPDLPPDAVALMDEAFQRAPGADCWTDSSLVIETPAGAAPAAITTAAAVKSVLGKRERAPPTPASASENSTTTTTGPQAARPPSTLERELRNRINYNDAEINLLEGALAEATPEQVPMFEQKLKTLKQQQAQLVQTLQSFDWNHAAPSRQQRTQAQLQLEQDADADVDDKVKA